MDFWHVIPAVLVGLGGLVLVPFSMAKARDLRRPTNLEVALTGLVALLTMTLLTLLTLLVFPIWVGWVLVAVVGVTVTLLAAS
jgi:hypothetical protein